jgi:hypothetical protein
MMRLLERDGLSEKLEVWRIPLVDVSLNRQLVLAS